MTETRYGEYLDAELCGHDYPEAGDAIHIAGDPVDMICLASPIPTMRPRYAAEIEDRLAEIVANDVTIMMRDGKPQITNPRGVAIKMVRAIARIEQSRAELGLAGER